MDESQEMAFQSLKDLLCAALILAYPVPGEKIILESDASGYGIRGIPSQVVNVTRESRRLI